MAADNVDDALTLQDILDKGLRGVTVVRAGVTFVDDLGVRECSKDGLSEAVVTVLRDLAGGRNADVEADRIVLAQRLEIFDRDFTGLDAESLHVMANERGPDLVGFVGIFLCVVADHERDAVGDIFLHGGDRGGCVSREEDDAVGTGSDHVFHVGQHRLHVGTGVFEVEGEVHAVLSAVVGHPVVAAVDNALIPGVSGQLHDGNADLVIGLGGFGRSLVRRFSGGGFSRGIRVGGLGGSFRLGGRCTGNKANKHHDSQKQRNQFFHFVLLKNLLIQWIQIHKIRKKTCSIHPAPDRAARPAYQRHGRRGSPYPEPAGNRPVKAPAMGRSGYARLRRRPSRTRRGSAPCRLPDLCGRRAHSRSRVLYSVCGSPQGSVLPAGSAASDRWSAATGSSRPRGSCRRRPLHRQTAHNHPSCCTVRRLRFHTAA